MFRNIFRKFSRDLGIDLGTTNTLIFAKGKGVVVNEASVVAINNRTSQILEVGREALKMLGKTPPHIQITQPLVDGVISDFEVAEKMLKYFIERASKENVLISPRPRVIIGIPLDVTEVEKKAVEDAALSAGASEVFLVENVIASSIGARLPIQDASGNMVVDFGGGLTEIAVISLSGVVAWKSLRTAGEEFDQEIVNYMREEFNLLVGKRVAEDIKIRVGSIEKLDEPNTIKIRGRDMITGLPREISVNGLQILQSIERSVRSIIDGIKDTLEITPPELIADIYQRGMILCGGGALLRDLDKKIFEAVKIPIRIIEDPSTCVVRGLGLLIEDEGLLHEIMIPSAKED